MATALITGASNGIGLELARVHASSGRIGRIFDQSHGTESDTPAAG